MSQAIFATPVDPARAESILGFEVGVAATAIPIDEEASYWIHSASSSDLSRGGHVFVPRLVASKGLSFISVSASYAQIPNTDVKMLGGNVDVPIIEGTVATPALTFRGTYSQLSGIDEYELRNAGAEVFISKGFGPVTPYAAAGVVFTQAEGEVRGSSGDLLFGLEDEFQTRRITVGVRISLLVPKIIVEATEGEERSYAAKISLGI